MSEPRKVIVSNQELFEQIRALVAEGHRVTFRVKGNSMNPFLVDLRDEAVVSPFERGDIVPGVLVLARDTLGRIVLHRVVRAEGEKIVLMGDGNCFGEETTSLADIAGMITEVIRNGRRISCDSRSWKWSSALWKALKPVRRWMLAIWRRM